MPENSPKPSVRTPTITPKPSSLKNLRPPWKKGQSGNPGGRPKEKPILEALREAFEKEPQLLAKIAAAALKQAKHNLGWFQEIRDMLDGKPDGRPTGSPDDPVNFHLNVKFCDAVQGKLA